MSEREINTRLMGFMKAAYEADILDIVEFIPGFDDCIIGLGENRQKGSPLFLVYDQAMMERKVAQLTHTEGEEEGTHWPNDYGPLMTVEEIVHKLWDDNCKKGYTTMVRFEDL